MNKEQLRALFMGVVKGLDKEGINSPEDAARYVIEIEHKNLQLVIWAKEFLQD